MILTTSILAFAEGSSDNISDTSGLDAGELALAGNLKTTYIARIMQGNTNEEEDCLATHNGLTDSGSYSNSNIVETGWTFINSTTSSMLTQRCTATNFKYAYLYDFAYYSGHGGRGSSIPTLNETPSNPSSASGTWSEIKVHTLLDIDDSTWRDDSFWQETARIRVLMLAACFQMDSSIMKYYARAMRASSMMAVAGYHESGPGHDDDVEIADAFFVEANDGNSIKYSWEHANEDGRSEDWAVLVYKDNSNQYYRIPGFPGNTYTTPSSTAKIYRYASHLSGSQEVTMSKGASVDTTTLPLYIDVAVDITKSTGFNNTREAVDSKSDLQIDYALTNNIISGIVSESEYDNMICIQKPVVYCEVNPDIGLVKGSEIITERIYNYFNTFNGIRINNSFISIYVDKDDVNTISNVWKTASNTTCASKTIANAIITEEKALESIRKAGYTEPVYRLSLIYQSVSDTKCKLMYEYVSTGDAVLYVDAETGKLVQ